MRSQQEAERAEQQHIKSLVLNYELTDEHDGEVPAFHYMPCPTNSRRTILVGSGSLNKSLSLHRYQGGRNQPATGCHLDEKDEDKNAGGSSVVPTATASLEQFVVAQRHDSLTDETEGSIDHQYGQARQDKSGNTRSKQRARKLQLGDIDWYDSNTSRSAPPSRSGLDDGKTSNGSDTIRGTQHRRAGGNGEIHRYRNQR